MNSLDLINATSIATPFVSAPQLSELCNLESVWIKNEAARPLGNFKILGGAAAGLKALAKRANCTVEELIERRAAMGLPALICASDGNHGLAVATGAAAANARAIIVLHDSVPEARRDRITATGAEIVTVHGTYDDAVEHAIMLASTNGFLLVPDTSDEVNDPVVADVMQGYGQICQEIVSSLANQQASTPTHVFVQAGVGGLAAAMCEGIGNRLASPRRFIVVEPEHAACVRHALAFGKIERIRGSLETTAEMLSCGRASASAMAVLQQHRASCLTVSDDELDNAVPLLFDATGIRSTPSGAAGVAGLLKAARDPALRDAYLLSEASNVLLICTEAAVDNR